MNSQTLTSQKRVPCEGDVKPFNPQQIAVYKPQVPDWQLIPIQSGLIDSTKLQREFTFKNFKEAISFINKVAGIAESEGHHPDICLHNWNKVTLTLWTHAIKGLFLNDFILAAKIDRVRES